MKNVKGVFAEAKESRMFRRWTCIEKMQGCHTNGVEDYRIPLLKCSGKSSLPLLF